MTSQPQPPRPLRLTKSKYLAGLQCPKRLYLAVHRPELATPPDAAARAVLGRGTEVGLLARRLWPGGVAVEPHPGRPEAALARTAALLADPAVPAIFEGALASDGALVRVDILERMPDGRGWRLTEVKASSRVKEVHLDDIALQAHVVEGAGVPLAGVRLLYVNRDYVFDGRALDLNRYFVGRDVTGDVAPRRARAAEDLAAMREVLEAPAPPPVEPGAHCRTPYPCPFWDHCTRHKPPRWIFRLPGAGRVAEKLAAEGATTIDEIPARAKLSPLQRRVRDRVEWLGPGLAAALKQVRPPVHHLDFETVAPAVPRWPGTRPFQAIPVQWSDHIEAADGSLRREEYLCTEPKDPREEFAATLLDALGGEGTICVYSSYERLVLAGLAEAIPRLKPGLDRVIARLWDLYEVIRENYYHPAFEGALSIKAVLPSLVPGLDYGDLAVGDGATAARLYERMVFEETDWVAKDEIRRALLDYCRRDALGLLELRKALGARLAAQGSG